MLSTKQAKRREEWRRALPLLRQGAAALAGAALAGGEVFGLYPLGLAAVLGAPRKFVFAGAAGAAAGCLAFLPPMAALRMVGAVAAGFAGRALAPKSRWAGAAAGISCLLLVEGLLLAGGLSSLGQGLAAAGEVALALVLGQGLAWGGAASARGALLWVGAFVPALESLAPGHAGFLLAGAAGLALAYRGEVKNAAAAAICWGGALAACGPELLPAAVALMAGVLAGAVFSPGEKAGCAGLFAAAQLCGLALGPGLGAKYTLGLCAGCLLAFGCLPREWLLALPGEKPPRRLGEKAGLAGASGQLTAVAEALTEVADTVEAVMERLPKKGEGFDYTVDHLARELCSGCPQRERCWVKEYNSTVKALYEVKPLLEEGQRLSVEQLPPQFYRCEKPAALCSCLCQGYAVQCSRRQATLRMRALRSSLAEQYGAMAGALAGMAEQLARGGAVDEMKSSRVAGLMETLGLEVLESLVQEDALGRTQVLVTLGRTEFEEEELERITEEVEQLCRRSFGRPQLYHCRTVTTLRFGEKPVYEAEFGLALRPAGQTSGDAARQFCDGSGCAHILLCDGMGTGRPAAIDGAMAANLADRLVCSGFEGGTAARLVNVALNLKSEEESSAALDLLTVDLYTGRGRLYKAGAAPSYLVSGGKLKKLEGAGLPVGILKEVQGEEHRFGMSGGDWVVMVSDGALSDGTAWLGQQVELCAAVGSSPQEMADIVADAARRRRPAAAPPDDITVAVMKLSRPA